MKKLNKLLKNNVKTLVAFIVGGIIFGTVAYAASTTIASSTVGYTKNGQANVEGALDTLYTRANTWVNPNDMGSPTNYIFDGENKPTTSSATTPPSGKNVYLGLYADNQYGVCIKRNGTQHCFRYNNWIAEVKHVLEVFKDAGIYDPSSGSSLGCDKLSDAMTRGIMVCIASDFTCDVRSFGRVFCRDSSDNSRCDVYPDGSVRCI